MEEKLKLEILTRLSHRFSTEDLKFISDVLIVSFTDYEIKRKTTSLIYCDENMYNEIKTFLVCKNQKGLTKETLLHYKRILMHFALNINKNVKSATANDIRLYLLNYESTYNISKSTLDDKRRVLNAFYKWMVAEDIILKNPMDKIEAIKYETKVKEPLTIYELEKIRNVCSDLRETALLEILYSTGARISEILALNKSDINFEQGRIKVYGKGRKERFVFLNAKAIIAIKKYILSRVDENEALFVISKKPYHRMGKGTAEKIIKNLGNKANIKRNVYPHLLRATAATHALSRGMSLADVQAMLGHKNPEVTMRYCKMNYDDLQYKHNKCII